MELSPWANHPKDQLSLSYRDQPYDETDLYEGERRRNPLCCIL